MRLSCICCSTLLYDLVKDAKMFGNLKVPHASQFEKFNMHIKRERKSKLQWLMSVMSATVEVMPLKKRKSLK